MSAVLSRRGSLLAVMAALALAFAITMWVVASPALAVENEEGICHVPPGHPENAHWIKSSHPAFDKHEANHPGDRTDVTKEECENLPPTDTTGTSTTTTGTGTSTTTTGTGTSTTGNNTTVNVNTTNTTANTTSTSVTQVTSGNIACVQTAVQQEVNKTQINQFGDNINIQNISQECNINVTEVQNIINTLTINQGGNVVVTTGGTTGGSTSTTGGSTSTTGTTTGGASVQYQYTVPSVQYQYAAPTTTVLPDTGGSSLLVPAGALLLLAGGGLLAFFVVKRGFAG